MKSGLKNIIKPLSGTHDSEEIRVLKEKNYVHSFDDAKPYIIIKTQNMLCPILAIRKIGITPIESKAVFIGILPLAGMAQNEGLEPTDKPNPLEDIGCELKPVTLFSKRVHFQNIGKNDKRIEELIKYLEYDQNLTELIKKIKPQVKISINVLPAFFMRWEKMVKNSISNGQIAWFIAVSKMLNKGPWYKTDICLIITLIELIARKLNHIS
ncbi:MAG: hypothetical protein QW482_01200 [Thermoproteota archaeon]